MEQPDSPSVEPDPKEKVEQDIEEFKNLVEGADVEEVDTPSGRKDVEIAWEDDEGFHVEEGEAVGVYREYSDAVGLDDDAGGEPRTAIECYHVDWSDERGRTTIHEDELVDLDEGEWKDLSK